MSRRVRKLPYNLKIMTITLSGDNAYRLGQELHKLRADFAARFGELALEQIDASDIELDKLADSLTGLSLISDKKLVIIKSLSLNKLASDFIEKYLADQDSETDLVIVEPKLDKRSTLYKTLKSKTDFREFNRVRPADLAVWLSSEAKQQGASLSRADAQYFIERVGFDQLRLKQEIDKLITYNPAITRESIDALCEPSSESTIFQLIDAAFNGEHRRLMRLYFEQRDLKVEPQQIIAMLAWQLYVFALIKLAKNSSLQTIAEETKLNPFVIRKSQPILRKISLTQLKIYIDDLSRLDIKMKTKKISVDDALKTYLISLAV